MIARRAIPAIVAIAMLVTMGPAAGLDVSGHVFDTNNGPGTPGFRSFGNITHVANVPSPSNQRGSDIEFVTKEVLKLSEGATGDPVCVPDETEFDGCARGADGMIIYQTEERDFALAGTYGKGQIVDVTDPENPVRVSVMPCNVSQNDIQVQGDLMFQAQDSASGSCTRADGTNQGAVTTGISDISNPRNPVFLGRFTHTRGSHNHTVHPTEPLVYVSDSDLANAGLGQIPIFDVSDPTNPTLVTTFGHLVHSPHDVTFNADGTRAYAAAVSATYILNTEDPRAPSVISTIFNEGISISHQADPTPDGKFLLVSDELGGGSCCEPSPGGPIHVYDIRDETIPVKVGAFGNDCQVVACDDGQATHVSTSHVFRINPDGYTMAAGWYNDGLHVFDFSSIRGVNAYGIGTTTNVMPRVIASIKMPNANTWTAKMWQERHPGYVFANDARGLDIFYMSDLDRGFMAYGTISGAHPGNYNAATGVTRNEWESDCDYTPRTNGVDGWVARVPAELADGTHTLKAEGEGSGWDLDLYMYDASCFLLAGYETAAIDEEGEIPEGTAYVMVTNYLGPSQPLENPIHVRLSVT